MEIRGSTTFSAPRQRVWDTFNDPDALKQATPGCEELKPTGDDSYEARMTVGIAAVKGTYKGTIRITEKEAPERYHLAIEGTGSPGFVKADADLRFKDQGDSTEVEYAWDVQVGGTIAGVGQRVLGGVGRWVVGEFFKAMQDQLRE